MKPDILKAGEPIEISEHMLATYQVLRVSLVIIAFAFPLVLWWGGGLAYQLKLQDSMSSYYHANKASDDEFAAREKAKQTGVPHTVVPLAPGLGMMRNWFVGVLFAIGGLLAVYKGFRPAEDIALNLAGVFAVLTAVFPKNWDVQGRSPHAFFAVSFFLCIAYVCFFCASATLTLVENKERARRYRRLYKLLTGLMLVSPVTAVILSSFLGFHSQLVFFIEAAAVYSFGAYWLVKTREISETNADKRAASGELQLATEKGASDAFKRLPVVSKAKQVDVRQAK